MRIEIRADSVTIDGYVNAVGRDSRVMRRRDTGERFIEQIVPGAFQRALTRNEVELLLNHDSERKLGSTETNLELYEDSIGLRAHAVITDPEVIQKARDRKLRGWSFGFREAEASEEDLANGMKRRYVEDLKLEEVSIIDNRKIPCYEGTSIEARAEELLKPDMLETRAEYVEEKEQKPADNSKYWERINALERK